MLGKADLGFTPSSMESGTTFIHSLTNCLWYVDPHLDKLAERSCFVPLLFESFAGFNILAKHKHKQPEHASSVFEEIKIKTCLPHLFLTK